jgi:general secretion pathway protein A
VYLAFYGLREKPFGGTPDPRFLYLAPSHREALAQLVYGVQQKKGFLVLTGEVGTGKTTLLHALLRRLDAQTAAALVFNSMLSFEGLLEYALEDFGLSKTGDSHAQRLMALNTFLIERRRAGQNTVLIIDEAQNLSPETLEQVRLLSNFETPTEKLLQILLVGQPELGERLALPGLRQLQQRIALRCRIQPLTMEEAAEYIRVRLRIAGARDTGLFAPEAIARITAQSGGIPRVVNAVCDHALLIGYADQQRRIDGRIVDEAIRYLEAGEAPGSRPAPGARGAIVRARAGARRVPRWAVVSGAVTAVALVALVPTLTLWPEIFHGVVSPLAELAARLRDLMGR